MDRQELGVSLNLALPEDQVAVEAHLDNVDLLILDNISTLVNSGRENDAESWNEMQAWLLKLRRMNKTVLLIHQQWFFVCPVANRRASVLWLPRGASQFASLHAWQGRSPIVRNS